MLNGPIPGENFTSNTKNQAWHRPPEFNDLNKAMDAIGQRLLKRKSAKGILSFLENGVPVATITQMFLMSGVGAGKWTVDFALLLAGPTARLIELMAKGYDVEYSMGIEEDDNPVPTKAFFSGLKSVNSGKVDSAVKEASTEFDALKEEVSQESSGFMGMGSQEEDTEGLM